MNNHYEGGDQPPLRSKQNAAEIFAVPPWKGSKTLPGNEAETREMGRKLPARAATTPSVATYRHCTAGEMLPKFSPQLLGGIRRRCQEMKRKHRETELKMPARAAPTPRVATYRHCTAGEMLLNFPPWGKMLRQRRQRGDQQKGTCARQPRWTTTRRPRISMRR